MMTAKQAFGWCRQYSIADLLIARDIGCELFTSGLDTSRFASVVRFRQSFHPGIHEHIQPHYGMAMYPSQKIDRCRPRSKLGRRKHRFATRNQFGRVDERWETTPPNCVQADRSLRPIATGRVAFPFGNRVQPLISVFRSSIARPGQASKFPTNSFERSR